MHSTHEIRAPMQCLLGFALAVKTQRLLRAEALKPAQTFWHYCIGLMMDKAAIEWCKVFGSRDQETHWRKVVPKDKHDSVYQGLLKAVELNEGDWQGYHGSVVDYRNKLAAHHDLAAPDFVTSFPQYDRALAASVYMYDVFYSLLDDDDKGGLNACLERWSEAIARNMQPIVRLGFEASSRLGSNVPGKVDDQTR